MIQVAIQGVEGCFHEVAARNYFADEEVQSVECDTFDDLFERVEADKSLCGIVAIENTIAGSLLQNHELLRESNLAVVGEYKLRISHVLCALPGDTMESIREVHSHPIALMQCGDFLKRHPSFKVVERDDTAGSAREIAERGLHGHAAICSARAARRYGMEILEEGIETNKHNFTRFLVVAHTDTQSSMQTPQPDKASLVFSLQHARGSLSKVLTILSFYDINLTKIQSLPIIGHEWEYRFYIDLTFDDAVRYNQAVAAILPLVSDLKTLGEYAEFKM
ncbi:MAG: prephenate dehydratase [Alistipes sp.]|nr:prephenate dehydratase [Alistipes sp.]